MPALSVSVRGALGACPAAAMGKEGEPATEPRPVTQPTPFLLFLVATAVNHVPVPPRVPDRICPVQCSVAVRSALTTRNRLRAIPPGGAAVGASQALATPQPGPRGANGGSMEGEADVNSLAPLRHESTRAVSKLDPHSIAHRRRRSHPPQRRHPSL